ncbi:hypothetical protein [Streptosporangium sandarakinum]|uniref:Uncharacterized protein n=1 Tax=Streptosporangium sandarakinum TaxID=1260955 RepID=A0A852UXW9_9ACTN|nr:hypothetical protein [Streptosporangium sandarakinum]NYF42507.1 hypothetical protein [Streptosporangium sandarakinum]
MREPGFEVAWSSLDLRARAVAERHRAVSRVRDTLWEAFERDRRTLGADQYGAEMEREMPRIEAAIFGSLQSHLDELDRIVTGLHLNARGYGQAEQASAVGG